jgi:choline transport protein
MSGLPPLLVVLFDGHLRLRTNTGSKRIDYCITAFFIVIIVATIQWFIDGRKNFTGPRIDKEALQAGQVTGIVTDDSSDQGKPTADRKEDA